MKAAMEHPARSNSRADTLSIALLRLGYFKQCGRANNSQHCVHTGGGRVVVHLVGADGIAECEGGVDGCLLLFDRFIHFCSHSCAQLSAIQLVLVGPNVPPGLVSGARTVHGLEVSVSFVHGIYDRVVDSDCLGSTPDVACLFQAGVWAYEQWKDTIGCLRGSCSYGIVITAYNQAEAEDDEETLRSWGIEDADFAWTPEVNPCRCDVVVRSVHETDLIENYWFQALLPLK